MLSIPRDPDDDSQRPESSWPKESSPVDPLQEYDRSPAGRRLGAILDALGDRKQHEPPSDADEDPLTAALRPPAVQHPRGNGLLVDLSDCDLERRTAGFFDLPRRNMRQP
ncbi:MAG: hypothetical protein NXI31_08705 [bacterium]|nr:hypothetical protein [bacterium]